MMSSKNWSGYSIFEKINRMKKDKKVVTIEKWYIKGDKFYYWIVDSKGEGIDGFSKKYQALDAIKRWGFVRKDTSVKERK